jgi:hypothetical protein
MCHFIFEVPNEWTYESYDVNEDFEKKFIVIFYKCAIVIVSFDLWMSTSKYNTLVIDLIDKLMVGTMLLLTFFKGQIHMMLLLTLLSDIVLNQGHDQDSFLWKKWEK